MYIQRKELGYFQQSLRKETVKSNADQEVGLELCYLIPNIRCIYICRYKGGNPRTHREVSKILPVDNTSRPEPCRTKPSMLRALNRAANALDDCRDIEAGGLRAQESPARLVPKRDHSAPKTPLLLRFPFNYQGLTRVPPTSIASIR